MDPGEQKELRTMLATILKQFDFQNDPAHFLVMVSITLTMIISLTIIVERCFRYWFQYDTTNSSAFMTHVQKLVMNNSIENAIRLCKDKRNQGQLLPYVLSEGLKRANDSTEEIENAMHHAQLAALPRVARRVPLLATTANVATLLGLLGTLFGLIKSFSAVAGLSGASKGEVLAKGISEALVATTFGLATALLCLLVYGVLMTKQTAIVDDINQNAARLMDLLYTRKMKIRSGQDVVTSNQG
jgi:biopolymer transport protein ExbB